MACHALVAVGALRPAPSPASQHARPAQGLLLLGHRGTVAPRVLLLLVAARWSGHEAHALHGLVLICRRGHAGGYYVFDPCTRALLALPDTKFPWKKSFKFIAHLTGRARTPAYMNVSYGLGYCSATGEYKVVRLFSHPVSGDAGEAGARSCLLYTSRLFSHPVSGDAGEAGARSAAH
ncbi:hypothetical protein E2562_030887 [Oryza meyeriana var. granulata]|uniref:Uncharacterized protein n=1 Tax=Oryza meyeriana var. granulata TaxID=110450 RepID=A0A6G1F026_9ORYZ|nr:hypothetical protein E2562_030887 [Oryza meyeriana var. granulata]